MSRSLPSCLLLLGILALPATTYLLSSCTLVNEPLVGLAKKKGSHCVKDCRQEFREAERECFKEYRQDGRSCRGLPPGPTRDACFEELLEDFVSCSDAALEERNECLNGCHTQGRGGGH